MPKSWIIASALAALTTACGAADEPGAPVAPTTPEPVVQTPPPEPAQLSGFTYSGDVDHFGYYMPTREVRVGDFRLDHLHIGSPMEFAAWAQGERIETYAPVMLHFDDVTSPLVQNAMGREAHTISVRVLPTAFKIGDGEVRFSGSAPEIGQVNFVGVLDLAAGQASRGGPRLGSTRPDGVRPHGTRGVLRADLLLVWRRLSRSGAGAGALGALYRGLHGADPRHPT